MREKLAALNFNKFVIVLLLLGVLFKLFVTSDGKFIFHIDSARDYVDVREMVELMKPRLIGQTSGIDGFYNGPGWYYLLAIPYILFDGDPYGGVVLMIVMWAIGGYFLYLITKKYGKIAWLTALLIWFASPYISLSTVYSFNPHPLIYLTPVFILVFEKYIKTGGLWYGLGTALLSALFFQWEMNTGVFMPVIVFLTLLFAKRLDLLKTKNFWISVGLYASSFLPQLLFDLRHNFIMSQAVMRFLGQGGAGKTDFGEKFYHTWDVFFGAFTPTLLNSSLLVQVLLVLFIIVVLVSIAVHKQTLLKNIDFTFLISFLIIIVPFVGYLIMPVNIHPWHMVMVVAATIVLTAFLVNRLLRNFPIGWGLAAFLLLFCLMSSWQAVSNGIAEHGKPSEDPSNFKNELLAIDYAYRQANGENFKAYVYLPSVIDFPYQYLFWWYGLKQYGYTPVEYTYLPNQIPYISNKEKFYRPKADASDSGKIILIKEPDRIKMRHLWEGNFNDMQLIDFKKIGPIEVETRVSSESAMIDSAP